MQPTRRKVLIGMGGVGIGTIGTILTTENTKAVEASGLDIGGVTNYGTPTKVTLDTKTEITWDTNRELDRITLTTKAGNGYDNLSEIDTTELTEIPNTGEQTIDVTANVLDSSAFAVSTFELLTGQSRKDVEIYVEQSVALHSNDKTIASDSIRDMAIATVKPDHTELKTSGTGNISMS